MGLATPVVETVGSEKKSRFNGRIPEVTITVKSARGTGARKALSPDHHELAGSLPAGSFSPPLRVSKY